MWTYWCFQLTLLTKPWPFASGLSAIFQVQCVNEAYVLQLLERPTCPPEGGDTAVGDPVICQMPCEPAQAGRCPLPGR